MTLKYLIVNADDYAFSPEINRGICEAYTHGIVTNCSMLVYSPYAADALRMAKQVGLPVGLHIDLVTNWVAEKSPYFGSQGLVCRELFRREHHGLPAEPLTCAALMAVRDEMRAQVERFTSLAGWKPSHLDYHFGLHHLPELMAMYLSVAGEYALPVRWGSQYAGTNPYLLSPSGLCDRFHGINGCSVSHLLELLERPWQGVLELVCHPGYTTPAGLEDSYNTERELELSILIDPQVVTSLEALGIALVNYDWLRQYGQPL
jgi:predicted glycoside hydrolase/deacetylase ChbG (UPF0249 family)